MRGELMGPEELYTSEDQVRTVYYFIIPYMCVYIEDTVKNTVQMYNTQCILHAGNACVLVYILTRTGSSLVWELRSHGFEYH